MEKITFAIILISFLAVHLTVTAVVLVRFFSCFNSMKANLGSEDFFKIGVKGLQQKIEELASQSGKTPELETLLNRLFHLKYVGIYNVLIIVTIAFWAIFFV